MKARLIKEGSFGYKIKFYNDDDMAACALGLLSLKNCQAIELGYDLDELAEKEFPLLELTNHTSDTYVKEENLQLLGHRKTYIKAFQKALEILSDKKFSEEDVMLGWDAGVMSKSIVFSMEQLEPHKESYQRNLKPASLQQTEWEVEVEMEDATVVHPGGDNEIISQTKLDADGCLILKRLI
jgi:hypothetical protein